MEHSPRYSSHKTQIKKLEIIQNMLSDKNEIKPEINNGKILEPPPKIIGG